MFCLFRKSKDQARPSNQQPQYLVTDFKLTDDGELIFTVNSKVDNAMQKLLGYFKNAKRILQRNLVEAEAKQYPKNIVPDADLDYYVKLSDDAEHTITMAGCSLKYSVESLAANKFCDQGLWQRYLQETQAAAAPNNSP